MRFFEVFLCRGLTSISIVCYTIYSVEHFKFHLVCERIRVMVVASIPLDENEGNPIFSPVVDPLPQDWDEAEEELGCRALARYFKASFTEVRRAFSADELRRFLFS